MKQDIKARYQKTVSEEQVIHIAKSIANNGKSPTIATIRKHLNYRGSNSTIHKYLSKWKIECYQKASKIGILTELNNYNISDNSPIIEEKNLFLEQSLSKQVKKNEDYAQELIHAEKANIEFKEEILQLQSRNQKLQLELTEAKATNRALEQIMQKIRHELDFNTNTTIQKKQQTIDDLRLELKTLNETYINALRETSTQGHEALMQERVVSINLQAKIDNLTKEFLDSKKKAYEASMTAQVQNRSLTRQNEQLQRIIQENGLDKLLQSEEGSSLAFTNGAAIYGK